MNILFISKSNPFESNGGAEKNSLCLVQKLAELGGNVSFCRSEECTVGIMAINDVFILEDFRGLKPDVVAALTQERYVLFENSYGFSTDKFMGIHPRDRKWIEKDIKYYEIYKNATAVFLQSWFQYGIFECNLPDLDNLVCLNGNFWSDEDRDLLEGYKANRDNPVDIVPNYSNRYAILDGHPGLHRIIKGVDQAVEYCGKNNIEYELIKPSSYEDYLSKLCRYEGLVFFPQVPETFSRVYIEAKCLGLQVISNNNIGAKRSDWETAHIPYKMSQFNNSAPRLIWDSLNEGGV